MKVIFNKSTGKVVAVGDAVAGENQSSVDLDESQITRPIDGTVVNDTNDPTKTINDITKIKSQRKEQIKKEAYSRLKAYDWYVIRKQEEGIPIPDPVSQYRSDVRETEDSASSAVENATTVEEVRSVDLNWPSEPDV